MRATIQDVAKLANVSVATVSRYLSDPNSVRVSSKEVVSKAIKELNFIPNSLARHLKLGYSNTVGLIVPDITHSWFSSIASYLSNLFFQNGLQLILCNTNNNIKQEQQQINIMLQQNAALIIVASCGGNAKFLADVEKRTGKILLFDRPEPDIHADCITENHQEMAYKLTNMLIQNNHRNFAILLGHSNSTVSILRQKGIELALKEHNILLPEDKIYRNIVSVESAKTLAVMLLQSEKNITCLCVNPNAVQGIFRATWALNMKINKDIYVASFLANSMKEQYNISVPYVRQERNTLGELLGEFAIKKINSKEKRSPQTITVPSIISTDGLYH